MAASSDYEAGTFLGNDAGTADLAASTSRRNQFRGGFTPDVLHEPFKPLGYGHQSSSSNPGSPKRGNSDNGSAYAVEAPLSSSIRKHTANKRSISNAPNSINQLGFFQDDSSTVAGSLASSAASSPTTATQQQSRANIGLGGAPSRSIRHNVIPSLTSAVPPALSSIRPKGWPPSSPSTASATTTGTSALLSQASGRAGYDSAIAWMIYYFLANLSLTLYNKLVMNKFPFAWSLTAVHTFSGCIGAQICLSRGLFVQQRLTTRENLVLIAFSSLYTINIAVSNLSLNLVTVPFHQVVRAMTPLFTILLATILLKKRSSRATWLSLIPVVAGVAFATYGDYYFTTWGLILTLIGTFLAALKTIVTNMILVGRLKLHPLDLLIRMSPLAFIQCMFASWWTGELSKVREFAATQMTWSGFWGLAINGAIAFALNVVSFTANKKTSALTMTVAANVKQVLTIVLAVMIFNLNITPTNLFGISLTLAGGALYAKVEYDQKNNKGLAAKVTAPSTSDANGTGINIGHAPYDDIELKRSVAQ